VLVRLTRFLSSAAVAVTFCATLWTPVPGFSQAAQPNWKDRAEYDLFDAIQKEADLKKKAALINQWKEKYPGTEFKKQRVGLLLQTFQQLGDIPNLVVAAKELTGLDPKDVSTLAAVCALSMQLNNASPEVLDLAEKSANGLIANLDNKPAAITDDQWKTQRPITEALGYRTLGWAAMQRKDAITAETNFAKSLEKNALQGDVSYWLGQMIMGQKRVEKYPLGLFHVARAVAYDGPGALAPQTRTQVESYLTKAYSGYHGDASGLDALKASVKTIAIPPPGFTIRSVKDIGEEKEKAEAEAAKANPQLALWKRIKEALQGAEGQQYFDGSMKDAAIPELSGTLVEQKGKELTVAVSDKTTVEITLQFENPLPGKAEPGTQITFSGVGKSYTREPFMLIMEVERKDLKGWPAPAPAKRPAAAKRPGVSKKK